MIFSSIPFWLGTAGCLIVAVVFIMLPFMGRPLKHSKWIGLGLVCLFSLLSIGFYQQFGALKGVEDRAIVEHIADSLATLHNNKDLSQEKVLATLLAIEANLPPSDVGWGYIGGVYQHLGFLEQAANAYHQAFLLAPQIPQYRLQEAYSLSKANAGRLPQQAKENLKQVLLTDVKNQDALNLLAIDAYQDQDYGLALAYWRNLIANAENLSEEDNRTLKLMIASSLQHLNGAESAEDNTARAQEPPSTDGVVLTVMVDISPELKVKTTPDKTVFIFAKAINGPPMPLAVQKVRVKDLPLTVTLDSSMAMMPNLSLATATRVMVGARVSQTGDPIPQPGDFEAIGEPLNLESERRHQVSLLISERR